MREEPAFAAAVCAMTAYLKETLVPSPLGSADAVRLTWPGAQEDFRLGLCLYDLEELGAGLQETARLGREERRLPGLLMSLRFLAFANRGAAFHSMEAGDELLLLEAVLRAVHSAPALPGEGAPLRLLLRRPEQREKRELWQSLGAPLQPAVYFALEPVPVPSSRTLRVPAVREVDIQAEPIERRRP